MALIEIQAAKHFVFEIAQLRGEKITGGLRRGQRGAGAQGLRQLSSGDLDRRLELREPRQPKAAFGAESLPIGRDQLAQRVKAPEQVAREVERRMTRRSGAQ